MRQVAMRDFQQKAQAAINGMSFEPSLVSNPNGPEFFLIPAQEDGIDHQYEELMRAQALTNLRAWQFRSRKIGLDKMSKNDINAEIQLARKTLPKKNKK